MFTAFAISPALANGAGAALRSLEESRHPLPAVALDLCEAFLRTYGGAVGDITTAAAGRATYVVRLALRLHAQHTEPEMRRRCLDFIGQLVALRAYGIEGGLDSIER
jgi:hypothetical protein